ncbi:NAD(P)/FAD-dependent oxidoreductase [Zeimonas arvi]|uniref:FAD-binding oxidoreductase n=1 Tax=Zeimonas arvi TaxID=2498847 RepID=A0A5C8NYA7_9BURK|nr:FAD-dependent oxidoreductase [Zeimonas arvi]TXL66106.1 FAD-binding oxidoreductase [Zeimonas arvi]
MVSESRSASVADLASLWSTVTPAGAPCPALDGSASADVVVIGAGFTGLSTALNLRKSGVDVAVLEAVEPGWGGSGRNNGQVIPTLTRPDPDDIEARHGEAGERFVALLRDSANTLFDTVREHAIAAEAEQTGWVQPVHTPGRIAISERRVRQWGKRGAQVELLGTAQVREMLGSDAWHGGFWNRSGGHVNPLALARGLAQAVVEAGGRIFGHTPVLDFARQGDQWVVRTPAGQMRARALVLATNAYTGEFSPTLAPRIARQVVPVLSWQMATLPLPEAVRATVIPGRQAMSDTHGDLHFGRWDARNRLVTGGAIIAPFNRVRRLEAMIGDRLRRLWPQIGEVRFDHVWNGYVGMTADFMPRFHRLGPDGWAWVGCNGRAVALSMALGGEFAKAVRGVPVNELALPLSEPAPLPLHSLARRVAPLMLLHYRQLDRREI